MITITYLGATPFPARPASYAALSARVYRIHSLHIYCVAQSVSVRAIHSLIHPHVKLSVSGCLIRGLILKE